MQPPHLRLALHFFLWFVLAGCTQTSVATPTPVTITIAGSTEMRPVLADLTAAYSERHPSVLFTLRGGGSILGEAWLESGQVDLAASAFFPTDEVTATPLLRVPIGMDAVAIVVHPSNPVADLTVAQLRDIYSGKILDWQAVGGEAGEIGLISREDGSATRMLFEERVMGGERVSLTAVVMPTSEDVVRYVARSPHVIGYVTRAYVQGNAGFSDGIISVRMVALDGHLPTNDGIASQRYFLTRPIFLIRRTADARLQSFLDFVLSPVGQEIVARYHVRIR